MRSAGRVVVIAVLSIIIVLVAAVAVRQQVVPAAGVADSVVARDAALDRDTSASRARIPSSTPRAALPPIDATPAAKPTGVETVTDADLALLAREIAMPLDGVDPTRLHSNFNEMRGGGTRPHEALDIMAPRRTPVRAATSGRVLRLFNSRAGGLMVYAADPSERFILLYGHLDGYADGMRDGGSITRGQVIGYVGSTGNAAANAPHLHFAILRSADVKQWSKGTAVDPLPILVAGRTTQ